MSRALDDLSLAFRPKVFELLARLVEQGIHVLIVDTLRTEAEHAANLAKGVSWTTRSKHLPRRLRGYPATDWDAEKSDAIDLCPWEQYDAHGPDKLGWDPTHPGWNVIRDEAEKLGLISGARWKQKDLGHVELKTVTPRPPGLQTRVA